MIVPNSSIASVVLIMKFVSRTIPPTFGAAMAALH